MTEPKQQKGRLEWVALDDDAAFASTPYPVRTDVDYTELTSSVRIHGVLTPLLCRPTANGLQVICGQKRLQAARSAELDAVPVLIRELTDAEAIRCYLSTKVHRGILRDEDQQGALTQLRELRKGAGGRSTPPGEDTPPRGTTNRLAPSTEIDDDVDALSHARTPLGGRLVPITDAPPAAEARDLAVRELCLTTQHFFGEIRAQRFIRAEKAEELLDDLFAFVRSGDELTSEAIYEQLQGDIISPHSLLCASLSIRIGEALDWKPVVVRRLAMGALLHDVGMVFIEQNGLATPGPLTRQQRDALPRHTRIGEALIETTETWHREVALCARDHHERFGGTGYPAGTKGEAVCRTVRLLACIDSYAALVSPRPHRPALAPDVALCRLEKAGELGLFDPTLLSAVVGELRCGAAAPASKRTAHIRPGNISVELGAGSATMLSEGV